jgi:hypothetical protein
MLRSAILLASAVLAGCASPGGLFKDPSASLVGITSSFNTYEDFKKLIKVNATYSQVRYANSFSYTPNLKNMSKQSRAMSDVCLNYEIADDVKAKDIQNRLKALSDVLDKAKKFLCSAPTVDSSVADVCPKNSPKSAGQAAIDFFKSLSAAATLTAMATYVPIAGSVADAALAVYNFNKQQQAYSDTIQFLKDPKTQQQFKFAIERLESDLKGSNDDLESNMRTWTTCEQARLGLASNNLRWNDGASQITFSKEATDFIQNLDTVQITYNNYKKSFILTTTKSLDQLEIMFAKLPSVQTDPSALQDILNAIDKIKANLDALNKANAAASSKGKST